MFLIRYCTESAKDPLRAADTNFDGMGRSLRNDYLKQVQRDHHRSDIVRRRREELEKENIRNGTSHHKGEAHCSIEESISELSPSEDDYGSSLDSYDDTTGHSQSDCEESSSEFSAPNEFLYSSMQTDVDDSRSCSRQNSESSRRGNTKVYVEQTTIAISRREKDRLLRAKKSLIKNPKSLLGNMKQSLDYSCSYISSEESSCEDYDAWGAIKEEDDNAFTSKDDESYNSRSQPDRNYTKHLYADGRQPPTSRGMNPKLANGTSNREEAAKNLDDAFCMSMTEDGSLREESTLCGDLSDFGSSRSCLPSFGYGPLPDGGYSLLGEEPTNKTPNLQRHVNFPVTPSPHKNSKELISSYLRAREALKSRGGSKKPWLGFLPKEKAPGDKQSAVIVGAKTQEATIAISSLPTTQEIQSSKTLKSHMIPERDSTNLKSATTSKNQIIVESHSKPARQDPEVDDSKNGYRYQFSRPETPECSIDYANVIDEFLQARGVQVVYPNVGEIETTRPLNLVQSARVDVSALSNPSYLNSSKQSRHLEFLPQRAVYEAIDDKVAYELTSDGDRPHDPSNTGGLGQRENTNSFELHSPSTLTSASIVYKRNDISSYGSRGDGAFAERSPTSEQSSDHLTSWSERRSDTDSYGFSIRNDDDDCARRDYGATSSRYVETYYDARDDEDRPHCMKACFGVDRLLCPAKTSGGYMNLEDSPPPFLKGRVVTPRTVHSPYYSPGGQDYELQVEI